MSAAAIGAVLHDAVQLAGVRACAVVDADTGMVLAAAGDAALLPVSEAASDYWRLCLRQRPAFGAMGDLRAQVVIHASARLTLVPCGPALLLVCVSDEPDRVDWPRWKLAIASLPRLADAL